MIARLVLVTMMLATSRPPNSSAPPLRSAGPPRSVNLSLRILLFVCLFVFYFQPLPEERVAEEMCLLDVNSPDVLLTGQKTMQLLCPFVVPKDVASVEVF